MLKDRRANISGLEYSASVLQILDQAVGVQSSHRGVAVFKKLLFTKQTMGQIWLRHMYTHTYTHIHIHVHTEDLVIPDPFGNKYVFCFSMPTALRFGIYTCSQGTRRGRGEPPLLAESTGR